MSKEIITYLINSNHDVILLHRVGICLNRDVVFINHVVILRIDQPPQTMKVNRFWLGE